MYDINLRRFIFSALSVDWIRWSRVVCAVFDNVRQTPIMWCGLRY